MGWNHRGWGWAAESIVALDAITADGAVVHCSEEINADLFWSARGSGPGFFAVVIQFHLQSREVPAGMLTSLYVWDISEYDAVLPWVIDTSRIADPDMEINALAKCPDNSDNAPPNQRINLIVYLMTFKKDLKAAQETLRLFGSTVPRRDTALEIDEYQITSIEKELFQQEKSNPDGYRYLADNAWLHDLPTHQLVDAMRDVFVSLPSPQSIALYFNLAYERTMPEMALSMQTQHYLGVYCIWKDSSRDDYCKCWLHDRFLHMHKVSPGVYIGDSDFQFRSAEFLAPGKREKLEEFRLKWDPKMSFCSYLTD